MRTHTLKEIANMKYNFLNKAYTEYAGTVIELLRSEEYHRCSNIWNMKAQPLAEVWLEEIKSGNRLVFVYKINGEFIGEGALVLNTNDPDYTIPGKRVYVSRMIVKEKYRGRGIGSAILSFLIEKAEKMGFEEMTIGVDKDNKNALHMYQKYGFSEILFEGADENGEYFKLMKKLV
ncbi:MAG: GNAT family N-acetyltransferase [Clostridia bacterium]|nr:GNAT family N-acetyltransferase [Clostridia bacterium]